MLKDFMKYLIILQMKNNFPIVHLIFLFGN